MFAFLVVGFAAATPLIKGVNSIDNTSVEDGITFSGKYIIIKGLLPLIKAPHIGDTYMKINSILDFTPFQTMALEKHNEVRALHRNTGSLKLDANLCKQAQVSYYYPNM